MFAGGRASDTFHLVGDALGSLVATIVGGPGDDRFLFHDFASLTGTIHGGAGRDALDYGGFAGAVAHARRALAGSA